MPADSHHSPHLRRFPLVVALAVATASPLVACGGAAKAQDVVVSVAGTGQISAEVGGLGRTTASVDIPVLLSTVGLKGTTVVQSVDVQIGQHVSRGQQLLSLDPTQLTLPVLSAQSHLASLQASLRQAQAALAAAQAAAGNGAALQAAVDQANGQLQQAQQQLSGALAKGDQIAAAIAANRVQVAEVALARAQAQQQADQARQGPSIAALQAKVLDLSGQLTVETNLTQLVTNRSASITSPIDGYVNQLNVTVGSPAPTSQLLVDVIDTSQLEVNAQVAVADRVGIQPGDNVDVTYAQLPQVVLHGSVTAISPGTDSLGLTVTVVVSAPNTADRQVPVGTQAFVHIRVPRQAAVTVPRLAVVTPDQAPTVFVVSGSSVQRRSVVLGRSDDVSAEIVKGVSAGDKVVIVGTQRLDDGSTVRVVSQGA